MVRLLATQPLTYREVGGTAGELPVGYRALRMSRRLGRGADLFEAASRRLMTWQVHQACGLRVRASCDTVGVGGVVELRMGRWPVTITAPCRVVYVVDERDRRGFGYGTLPGHPESGEEAFLVCIDADEEVTASIVAFSRPSSVLARVGGRVTRHLQVRATGRYLDAMTP